MVEFAAFVVVVAVGVQDRVSAAEGGGDGDVQTVGVDAVVTADLLQQPVVGGVVPLSAEVAGGISLLGLRFQGNLRADTVSTKRGEGAGTSTSSGARRWSPEGGVGRVFRCEAHVSGYRDRMLIATIQIQMWQMLNLPQSACLEGGGEHQHVRRDGCRLGDDCRRDAEGFAPGTPSTIHHGEIGLHAVAGNLSEIETGLAEHLPGAGDDQAITRVAGVDDPLKRLQRP